MCGLNATVSVGVCLEVAERITVLATKLQCLLMRSVCARFVARRPGVARRSQRPSLPAQDFRLRTHTQAALMRMKRQAVCSLKMVRALTKICVLVQ